ncbi:MAG: Maf family nucleotide pyrophosphatase [Nevskiales bacterium]|nr:Maf family nucleotide pyrophosphatase [Nevskiales bacterium]
MASTISKTAPLILASSSRYRLELLARLRVPFTAHAPEVDETPLAGETPASLAQRLALVKARAVAQLHPGRWVLGSDQVASTGEHILGKPGTRARALEQLQSCSGKSVTFDTAMVLLKGPQTFPALDTTLVRFRTLTRTEIEHYLDAEPALDCAGGFKAEGLGIALLSTIKTCDPTALIGLPLIAVRHALAQAGFCIP